MKLLIVESNKRLFEEFTKTRLFQVTTQPNLQLISQLDIEAIIIDSETIPIHSMIEKLTYLEDYKFVFYILTEENRDIVDLCKANKIIPIISSDSDIAETYNTIKKILYPENALNNRLFLFFGADRKAGVTTTVHATASALAQSTTKKVLVVALTAFRNNNILEFSKSSIDHLRTSINSRVVTFDEVIRESEKIQNYYFLGGAKDIIQAQNYQVEDIIYLLEVLRKQEDYLVLVDGGGDLYNPLVMAALQRIHNKYIVLKHSNSYYKQLDQYINQVLSVHPLLALNYQSFKYILNEFDETVDSAKFLTDKECICVAKLPKSFYGTVAESQYISLSSLDKNYEQAISNISNLIAIQSGTKIEEVSEKEPLIKRLLKIKKKGGLEHGVPTQ